MTDKEKIQYAIAVFKTFRGYFADGSKLAKLADESVFMLETEKYEQPKATK